VSGLAVALTVATCLSAILGYVVLQYGLASLPEFLAFTALLFIALVVINAVSPFLS
jgi:hypothetical protein